MTKPSPLPAEAFDTQEPPNTLTQLLDAMMDRVEAYVIEVEAYAALYGEFVAAVRGRRTKPALPALPIGEGTEHCAHNQTTLEDARIDDQGKSHTETKPIHRSLILASLAISRRTRVTTRAMILEALRHGPLDRPALFAKVQALGYAKTAQVLGAYAAALASKPGSGVVRVSRGVWGLAPTKKPDIRQVEPS